MAGVFTGVEMYNRPNSPSAESKDSRQAKNPDESIHIVCDAKPRDLKVMVRGDVTLGSQRASYVDSGSS